MSDTTCTVSFDGEQGGTYIVPCDAVQYLSDTDLKNTSSSNIYLYKNIGANRFYLTVEAGNIPRYSSQYSSVYISNVSNIKFNAISNVYRALPYVHLFSLFILCVYCLIKLVRFSK